jgi:thiamine biosynthesis lipoprotein
VRLFRTLVALGVGGSLSAAAAEQRFEFESPQMGTKARIVLYAASRPPAERVSKAAFARIAELDARLSDYREDSEISRLAQRAGGPAVPASRDLFAVLSAAQELALRSDGAFDVTVGPLTRLWRRARRQGMLPDPSELMAARLLVGPEALELKVATRTVRLRQPGMRLDLGGIAKGYAADEAFRVIRSNGFTRALVELGGEVVVGAPPPGLDGWIVVLRTAGLEAPPLLLADNAVSTSGDAEQWVEVDGVRYSHVVDPRTGLALTGRRSVTVVARTGFEADPLATAASVLGPERGRALVEEHEGAAALIVEEGPAGWKTVETRGWSMLRRAGKDSVGPDKSQPSTVAPSP